MLFKHPTPHRQNSTNLLSLTFNPADTEWLTNNYHNGMDRVTNVTKPADEAPVHGCGGCLVTNDVSADACNRRVERWRREPLIRCDVQQTTAAEGILLKESCWRNPAEGILLKESCWRNPAEGILLKESCWRNPAEGILLKESCWRNPAEGILLKESCWRNPAEGILLVSASRLISACEHPSTSSLIPIAPNTVTTIAYIYIHAVLYFFYYQ